MGIIQEETFVLDDWGCSSTIGDYVNDTFCILLALSGWKNDGKKNIQQELSSWAKLGSVCNPNISEDSECIRGSVTHGKEISALTHTDGQPWPGMAYVPAIFFHGFSDHLAGDLAGVVDDCWFLGDHHLRSECVNLTAPPNNDWWRQKRCEFEGKKSQKKSRRLVSEEETVWLVVFREKTSDFEKVGILWFHQKIPSGTTTKNVSNHQPDEGPTAWPSRSDKFGSWTSWQCTMAHRWSFSDAKNYESPKASCFWGSLIAIFDLSHQIQQNISCVRKTNLHQPLSTSINLFFHLCEPLLTSWLVVGPPLWKIWKSIGMISNPILMGK